MERAKNCFHASERPQSGIACQKTCHQINSLES
jgi:hypothetical protein